MSAGLALAISIAVGAVGQLALKAGAVAPAIRARPFPHPLVVAGLLLYFVSALLYVRAIREIPLSRAFPTVSASYVGVALLAHLVFGESLGGRYFVALGLIATGIYLLHAP